MKADVKELLLAFAKQKRDARLQELGAAPTDINESSADAPAASDSASSAAVPQVSTRSLSTEEQILAAVPEAKNSIHTIKSIVVFCFVVSIISAVIWLILLLV